MLNNCNCFPCLRIYLLSRIKNVVHLIAHFLPFLYKQRVQNQLSNCFHLFRKYTHIHVYVFVLGLVFPNGNLRLMYFNLDSCVCWLVCFGLGKYLV